MIKFYPKFYTKMRESKKLVNLVSLVVLVATNIISPLSYATAGEEFLDIGDTASYWADNSSDTDVTAHLESGAEEGETPMDSLSQIDAISAIPQNDGDIKQWEETFPITKDEEPLEVGNLPSSWEENSQSFSDNYLNNNEQNNEDSQNSLQGAQNDGGYIEWQIWDAETTVIDELKNLIENEENPIQIIESEEIYWTWEYEWVKVEVYA